MPVVTGDSQLPGGPKRREKHHSYDESIDEPAELLEDEPVDIEAAIPAEENEPVETIEDAEDSALPGFDEGAPSPEELHE